MKASKTDHDVNVGVVREAAASGSAASHESPAAAKDVFEPEVFGRLDMRVGTIREARLNPKARVPAYVLDVDFGKLGTRRSSGQFTANYAAEDLIGKQCVGVLNLPEKRIAGIKSNVLLLGAASEEKGTVMLRPTMDVENGSQIF